MTSSRRARNPTDQLSPKPSPRPDQLNQILEDAQIEPLTQRSMVQLRTRDIIKRLGSERIAKLVVDYQSGISTNKLMTIYSLSKTSVLKLLRQNGVTMRRQPPTTDQVKRTVALYSSGKSLAAIEEELDVPRESLRRALLDDGVQLRPRGGSKSKGSPALRL